VYRKELSKALRNVFVLSVITVALAGCLSQKGSGSGFADDGTPQGTQATPAAPATPTTPAGNSAPTISGKPMTAVNIDNEYMFVPTASDPDQDELEFSIRNKPSWADFDAVTGKLSGQPTLENVGTYASITITASDGEANASLPKFAISVDQLGTVSMTLNWNPPTQNEDGSPLMDLAGYKIYWGTVRGQYTHSATIDNPGVSSYVVENLSPGTYEFAGTSFNHDGVESEYSNAVVKVLN